MLKINSKHLRLRHQHPFHKKTSRLIHTHICPQFALHINTHQSGQLLTMVQEMKRLATSSISTNRFPIEWNVKGERSLAVAASGIKTLNPAPYLGRLGSAFPFGGRFCCNLDYSISLGIVLHATTCHRHTHDTWRNRVGVSRQSTTVWFNVFTSAEMSGVTRASEHCCWQALV